MSFLSALLAIVIIDLVLAGDNAIVIALAARRLPTHLQRRAVMWGAVGAVAVRSVMTLGVVWLLGVPGLRFAGGALLLWIAYKLLVPNQQHSHEHVGAPSNFWNAMKTIIIADAVMGIDNVLAVAGAAHGSYLLVVLGLLISIPIVIWGSTFILRYTERFPVIIYVGAAVLVVTGIKMMLAEPLVHEAMRGATLATAALYFVATTTLLLAGYYANVTERMRIALRTHAPVRRKFRQVFATQGGMAMTKVLLPVDGSENSLSAVRKFIEDQRSDPAQAILLNVQPRFHRHIAQFAGGARIVDFQSERAKAATAAAEALLQHANVPYEAVMGVGPRAEVIVESAKRHGCSRIVLATARKNSLTRLFENSVTAKLLETAPVPVEIVVGAHASRWERLGLPAGIGAAVAALLLAAD
jgi:YjbE family integral membrane protein